MIEFFIYLHWNSFDCCVVDKINLVLFRMSPLCPLKASSFSSPVSILMQPSSPTRWEYLPLTPWVKWLTCVSCTSFSCLSSPGGENCECNEAFWLEGVFFKYIYERDGRSSRCSRRWTGSLLPWQAGWGPVQPHLVSGTPAHDRGVGTNDLPRFLPIQIMWWFYYVSLLLGEFFVLFRNNPVKLH